MDRNDQLAIESLFGKLAAVERQSPPRDAQSEAFIRERINQQPAAPYYMAQTIVVQQQALEAAQSRIEELEASHAPAADSGGLFGSLFGGGGQPAGSGSVPRVGRAATGSSRPMAGQQGGGFLAGAAQTAMGVAGGVLLANAIGSMFGADEAQAAEDPAADPAESTVEDANFEESGFDNGGDFGDIEF